jgi:hypothetical protein
MTPAGLAKLPTDVIKVWRQFKPQVIDVDPSKRRMRFADEKVDYLSMVKRPALTQCTASFPLARALDFSTN